ncbi:hypothetical protein D9M68_975410 [compost metagenome]
MLCNSDNYVSAVHVVEGRDVPASFSKPNLIIVDLSLEIELIALGWSACATFGQHFEKLGSSHATSGKFCDLHSDFR